MIDISGLKIIMDYFSNNPKLPQKTQVIIPIEKVYDHLITKSLWSEDHYRKFNIRDFLIVEFALKEIVEKAKSGNIIIRGSRPNHTSVKEIESEYWVHGSLTFSGSYITTFCQDINRRLTFITYNHLEVMFLNTNTIWQSSSWYDRFYSKLHYVVKLKIYSLIDLIERFFKSLFKKQ